MLQGVLIDEAIEVLFQLAGDCGRSPGARAIHEALGPLSSKAMHPCAPGRIGKRERVRDMLEAPAFDDIADSLGTTEDARLFGLPPGAHLVASGTPAYRSPEQVSDAFGHVSDKSDTYALGVILYELLTGQRPYEILPDSSFETLRRTITEVLPAPLGQYREEYRGELEMILLKGC